MKCILVVISFSFAQVVAPIGFGEKEPAEIDTSNAIITCLVNHPKGYNCDYGKTTIESYEHRLQRIDAEYDRLHPRERVVTVGDYFDYAEECYADTIKAKQYIEGNIVEYIIETDEMLWMKTIEQLEDDGYFYQYRWVTNEIIDEDNPVEFEYIFVKEPTLKGFIEWLKENKQ